MDVRVEQGQKQWSEKDRQLSAREAKEQEERHKWNLIKFQARWSDRTQRAAGSVGGHHGDAASRTPRRHCSIDLQPLYGYRHHYSRFTHHHHHHLRYHHQHRRHRPISLYVCIRVRLFTLSSSYVHNPLDRVMVRGWGCKYSDSGHVYVRARRRRSSPCSSRILTQPWHGSTHRESE